MNSKESQKMTQIIVSLTIGSMICSNIQTNSGGVIDEISELKDWRFNGTEDLDAGALTDWIANYSFISFDGDLDNEELFASIEAIKIHGPSVAEYTEEGLRLDDMTFYLKLKITDGSEEDFDDLFHIIVPTVEFSGHKLEFTDFEEYTSEVDELPSEGKIISVKRSV